VKKIKNLTNKISKPSRKILRVFLFTKKMKKMKNYKLNYKNANSKVLVTLNLLAKDLAEALSQTKVLLEFCRDKRVTNVEVEK
jgi:hypothetical protein